MEQELIVFLKENDLVEYNQELDELFIKEIQSCDNIRSPKYIVKEIQSCDNILSPNINIRYFKFIGPDEGVILYHRRLHAGYLCPLFLNNSFEWQEFFMTFFSEVRPTKEFITKLHEYYFEDDGFYENYWSAKHNQDSNILYLFIFEKKDDFLYQGSQIIISSSFSNCEKIIEEKKFSNLRLFKITRCEEGTTW